MSLFDHIEFSIHAFFEEKYIGQAVVRQKQETENSVEN